MKVIKPNTLPTTMAGFSRASTATYVDDAGVLQTAGVNVPRWERGRLLVEGAATNLLYPSEPTVAQLASTGNLSNAASVWPGFARSLLFASVPSHCWGYLSAAIAPGNVYTLSVYVLISGGAPVFSSVLPTSDGMLVSFGDAVVATDVQRISGDLYRVSFTGTSASGSPANHGVVKYSGNSARSFWVMGYQLELGAQSSYIPTTTTAATRAADVLTGTGLLYTTATDATPAYAAGTTYAAGAQVAYDRSRYQSLQAANTGHTPDVSPTWWARLGPVNQWAMFDDQVSTQTVQASGPLRVALQAGAMDSLAVLGVEADRVRLVVQDGAGGPVVYDQEQGMAAEAVASWFDYFFNDPTFRRTQALFSGIPPFGSSVATLTFSGSSVKVGHVSYGRVRSLGGLRYGARAGIKDFSRKDTDDFGVTTFVRRANSKYLTGTLEVEKFAINQAHNLLTSLTATPVVWIGSEDAYYSDTLLVFGFFRDFYCSIDYPTLAIYSLEIEGLI